MPGCVSIHDNILVWGTTTEDHEANLEACLQRMGNCNLTAYYSKCNFGKTAVSWFGWIFSADGMSADPRKIQSIIEAGRPQSAEDVKSFLQACQFNARFMLDSNQAYAQITAPLRALTKKNAIFRWTEECEEAYLSILNPMTSETSLRPFDPTLKTNLVTDAGPTCIAASVFQELKDGTWVPIDHASRSLTPCEMNYSQIQKESLAQAWGMNIHRYYLLGIQFDSYTDHQPLVPIYSGLCRGNARVERHRLKVQGFQYEMKYLPGKENPRDYQSRHPLPLETYSATTGRHGNRHGWWTLHKQNHHRWSTRRCHIADDSDSYRAKPYNAEADQSHTERIHWKWPWPQTIQTCFSRTLTGTRSDSAWWQTGNTGSWIHTRIRQPTWNHSWPSSWGTSGSCEMQAATTIQIMVPRPGQDGWEEGCRMSHLPSHHLHPKQRPPKTESSTWQTLAEDRHGHLGTTSKWRTRDGHGGWVFEVPRSRVCTQHQCSCSGTTCRQDIHNTWISRADQNRWRTTIQWHWHTPVPTIHEMGRNKTHICITGTPRSQRSRLEVYESRQESLAHIPHRKEELQTGSLQIPSSLQSHSPYIHWQSTIRNHVQSKNTHTSLSLSGASTWPTAPSTAWQIEGHPKVLQRCQVQCQAAQHSHWGQCAPAPERIKNTKPLWPPSIPGHCNQRKPDHSPAGWQSTTSRCEDVQEGVSKPTTAIFQPKIPPRQTQRGS